MIQPTRRAPQLPMILAAFWLASFVIGSPSPGADSIIDDMNEVRHRPGDVLGKDKQKLPIGTVESIEGKFGKAVRFNFVQPSPGLMMGSVKTTADWNDADGISFWVKGDGPAGFGGIELIDRKDFGLRYGYCFPVTGEWTKVTVAWRDLVPELAGPPIDAKGVGYAPANFGSLWVGRWHYWREFPPISFAIDQIALEKSIERPKSPGPPPGLSRLQQKLKDKKPVTIVTMGDSLTDPRHWANRKTRWSELLAEQLKSTYGAEVKVVNPAIGGTTVNQNVVLTPRWFAEAPSPDLVTVFFGGNDWDNGVRGERFTQYLRMAVDRIRAQTNGSADILLITTCPAHARWETYKELEDAVRAVAAESKTGIADVAVEFRKAGGTPDDAMKAKCGDGTRFTWDPKGTNWSETPYCGQSSNSE